MIDIIRDYEKLVKITQQVFDDQEVLQIAPLTAGQRTALELLINEQQEISNLVVNHEQQQFINELIQPLRLILVRIQNRLGKNLLWKHPIQDRLLTEFVDESSAIQLYTNLNQTIQMNFISWLNKSWNQNSLRLTPPLNLQMSIDENNLQIRTEFSEMLLPNISLTATPRDLVEMENKSNQIAINIAITTHINHLKHMLAGLIPDQFEILKSIDLFEHIGNQVYRPIYEYLYKEIYQNKNSLERINLPETFSTAFVTSGLIINAKDYISELQTNTTGDLKALYADAYLEFKDNLPKIGGENIFDSTLPKLYVLTFREPSPLEKKEYYFVGSAIDIYSHPQLQIDKNEQILLSSGIITISQKAYTTFNELILTDSLISNLEESIEREAER